MKAATIAIALPIGLALAGLISAAIAGLFWVAWNAAAPPFGAPQLSFWSAWGVSWLLLFISGVFRAVIRGALNGAKNVENAK